MISIRGCLPSRKSLRRAINPSYSLVLWTLRCWRLRIHADAIKWWDALFSSLPCVELLCWASHPIAIFSICQAEASILRSNKSGCQRWLHYRFFSFPLLVLQRNIIKIDSTGRNNILEIESSTRSFLLAASLLGRGFPCATCLFCALLCGSTLSSSFSWGLGDSLGLLSSGLGLWLVWGWWGWGRRWGGSYNWSWGWLSSLLGGGGSLGSSLPGSGLLGSRLLSGWLNRSNLTLDADLAAFGAILFIIKAILSPIYNMAPVNFNFDWLISTFWVLSLGSKTTPVLDTSSRDSTCTHPDTLITLPPNNLCASWLTFNGRL